MAHDELIEAMRGHAEIMERDKGKFVRFIDVATCTQAADRIEQQAAEIARLREALRDLLEDTQHKDHDCGDEEWCPVIKARAALEQEP